MPFVQNIWTQKAFNVTFYLFNVFKLFLKHFNPSVVGSLPKQDCPLKKPTTAIQTWTPLEIPCSCFDKRFSPFWAWLCSEPPWSAHRRLRLPWVPWRGQRSSMALGRRWRRSPWPSASSPPSSPSPPPLPPLCCISSFSGFDVVPSRNQSLAGQVLQRQVSADIKWNRRMRSLQSIGPSEVVLSSTPRICLIFRLRIATSKAPIASVATTIAQSWTSQCSRQYRPLYSFVPCTDVLYNSPVFNCGHPFTIPA